MYPVPPQRWQSFGSTPPPQLQSSFSLIPVFSPTKLILLRNTNMPRSMQTPPTLLQAGPTQEQPVQKLC
jgi:hypothetical protein